MCDLVPFDVLTYAWGKSSLGDFIAVRSDRGLVAFEFATSAVATQVAVEAHLEMETSGGTGRRLDQDCGHAGTSRACVTPSVRCTD